MGPFREHGRPSGSIFGPLEIKIAVITEQSVRSVRKMRESAFRILRFISKPLFAPESLDKPCESHDFALALSVSRAYPGLHAPPGDENQRKINKKSKLNFVCLFGMTFNYFSLKFDSNLRPIRI